MSRFGESIRLDSALGRALISILLVFAQMEREATGERTREAIITFAAAGITLAKCPMGRRRLLRRTIRAKVLVEDDDEQAVIAQLKTWAAEVSGITEMAQRPMPQGRSRHRASAGPRASSTTCGCVWSRISPRPFNERPHSDAEVKVRIVELRGRGHTQKQIASILNEQGWIPLKGRQFTERNVRGLLASCDEAKKLLSPRRFLLNLIDRLEREHERSSRRALCSTRLSNAGEAAGGSGIYDTEGHAHWWPAQVQQVLDGRFDAYYQPRGDQRSAFISGSQGSAGI